MPLVYLNDKSGSGHFSYTPARAAAASRRKASALAVGDVDDDGDLDVVMGQIGGAVRIYVNRGDAFLDDRSFTNLPDQVRRRRAQPLLADLDGDCLPDLVVAARRRRAASVALGGRRQAVGRRARSISRCSPPAPAPTTSTATATSTCSCGARMTGLQLEVQQ